MSKRVRVLSKSAGKILKDYRMAKSLSQDRLAELIGCDKSVISKLEANKKTITVEWARRLAPHLGLSPYQLLPNLGLTPEEQRMSLVIEGLNEENKKALEDFYLYLLQKQQATN